MNRTSIGIATVSVLAGCTAHTQYTAASAKGATARPLDCAFDVLSMRPAQPIQELGIIDFEGGTMGKTGYRMGVPSTATDLREKIGPEVCRAGGDAVVTEVNGVGQYVRATVVRYLPQP